MTVNTTDINNNLAPELQVSAWFNTAQPLTLAALRGKVVVLHAFQMLCPGCVQFGTPQTQRMFDEFDPDRVAVIGLHTVFENHAVMGRDALEVFVREYRLRFPIGIDKYEEGQPKGIPMTMRAYRMQGTPSLLLIDKAGRLRLHKFGHVSDLMLGLWVGTLLPEEIDLAAVAASAARTPDAGAACDADRCSG